MNDPHEIESTLLIASATPAEVATRVADLDSLEGFALLGRATQSIHDVYFDLGDQSLGARGVALRVRELNGSTLLTLKADSKRSGDVTDRVEIEVPWSPAGLARVVEALKTRHLPVREPGPAFATAPAPDALAELGFERLQERETNRVPRDVVPMGGDEPVAEMAVDSVAFLFAAGTVRLHEIEIEARRAGTIHDVGLVASQLRAACGDELQPWPYSKLATGMAIATLLARGELSNLVNPSGAPTAPAYQAIEALLRSGKIGA
jgi:inorganic triphosphatase YgiF